MPGPSYVRFPGAILCTPALSACGECRDLRAASLHYGGGTASNPCLALQYRKQGYMCVAIELRPNDLASPRAVRRTDDFFQNSNLNRLSCPKARPLIHT